jgi:hypothetical protein
MERTKVDSSMITSIWYDKKEQILEIEFNSWSVYQYYDIPLEEYEWIMSADSHGQYFHSNINECYEYWRIS